MSSGVGLSVSWVGVSRCRRPGRFRRAAAVSGGAGPTKAPHWGSGEAAIHLRARRRVVIEVGPDSSRVL